MSMTRSRTRQTFSVEIKILFRFVLQHLVGKITLSEIEDMITTVDKNKDGKISYSEFRVSLLICQNLPLNYNSR